MSADIVRRVAHSTKSGLLAAGSLPARVQGNEREMEGIREVKGTHRETEKNEGGNEEGPEGE